MKEQPNILGINVLIGGIRDELYRLFEVYNKLGLNNNFND